MLQIAVAPSLHPNSFQRRGGGLMWGMPVDTVITLGIEQDISPLRACYGLG